jgi:hypothetical protein
MSAPPLTARSKPKPPPSDEIVELQPPPEWGFGGTALLRGTTDAELIAELIRRGYSRIARVDPEA